MLWGRGQRKRSGSPVHPAGPPPNVRALSLWVRVPGRKLLLSPVRDEETGGSEITPRPR